MSSLRWRDKSVYDRPWLGERRGNGNGESEEEGKEDGTQIVALRKRMSVIRLGRDTENTAALLP